MRATMPEQSSRGPALRISADMGVVIAGKKSLTDPSVT
jgi:hypothetical protein